MCQLQNCQKDKRPDFWTLSPILPFTELTPTLLVLSGTINQRFFYHFIPPSLRLWLNFPVIKTPSFNFHSSKSWCPSHLLPNCFLKKYEKYIIHHFSTVLNVWKAHNIVKNTHYLKENQLAFTRSTSTFLQSVTRSGTSGTYMSQILSLRLSS